eukprot:TRINITY_DN2437_c0_g1_i6.p1 TRINITY_DN2437_c0_g1~~TRINITY_DN2437_c0_g1_i6.p1  ORF type:complete len:200 (+),score=53.26 TRINITY_DN2437_c0_g1_i6:202-801(+)
MVASTPTSKQATGQRQFIDMFRRKKAHNSLSPNEITMIYQILISKVPAFEATEIPKHAVLKLLKSAVIQEMTQEQELYQHGAPTDKFTLLLEGHVEIVCGVEGFMVEVGPWTPIGCKALSTPGYSPDFTATPRQDGAGIKYMQISLEAYQQALNSSQAAPVSAPGINVEMQDMHHDDPANLQERADSGLLDKQMQDDQH